MSKLDKNDIAALKDATQDWGIESYRPDTALGIERLRIIDLLDTIEALQQEVKDGELKLDALTRVYNLEQHENEQLKGQIAVKNEFILGLTKSIKNALEADGTCRLIVGIDTIERAEQVLSTNTEEYHNPADVEALKMAREALVIFEKVALPLRWEQQAKQAITAIDKAIGGGKGE
jgi:hypothetical protein